MTLERGTLLHKRYRIVEILGQGGMGSVYRAVDENLGVEVAVKENLFTTDEYARQFRLEAVILASLRQPNLPRVTDHFVIGEQGQYIIMDYIEGEDLRQRMERLGSITEEEAILIGAAMCDALAYLHTRKPVIVHRDVKPGNVKITPEGHIYLVDFGLAKVVRGNQPTTTGARAMTPGYSPPEQYGTARTEPRSDIYSLGATLYASLCGVIPEDGLARAMDNVELTPLRKRNPKISRRLAAAIEKAMSIRPEDRFQNGEEFKQALLSSTARTQHLEGEIIVEPPPQIPVLKKAEEKSPEKPIKLVKESLLPPSEPAKQPSSRSKPRTSFWVSFSFFLMTLLAILILLFFFWTPISNMVLGLLTTPTPAESAYTEQPTTTLSASILPDATITVTPTQSPTMTPTRTVTPTKTFTPTVTSTPTETPPPTSTPLGGGYGLIAFVSDRMGAPQIFIMNLDGSNQQQITNIPDGACQPEWSPDGQQIVFTTPCLERQILYPDSGLSIINADGSGLITLTNPGAGDFDPDWSPDGTRIAFTSLRDGSPQIYVLNRTNNAVTRLTEASKEITESRQPFWSPLGTQIVYTVKRLGLSQIWTMSDAGRGPVQLVRSGNEYYDHIPIWSPDGQVILFSQAKDSWQVGWLMSIHYAQRDSQTASRIKNGSNALDANFSPDGAWLVFESTYEGFEGRVNFDICISAVDDAGKRTRLTTDPAMDFDPAWRPGP